MQIQNIQPTEMSQCHGYVVYIYAFDIAYDMKRIPLDKLLGQPVNEYSIGQSKRIPKQLLFYRPQTITLPDISQKLADKPILIQRSVKIFNVGAVSIQIRVPFTVEKLEQLAAYHELILDDAPVMQHVSNLAQHVMTELEPFCIRPITKPEYSEDYTVFCINHIPGENSENIKAQQWLEKYKRQIAGVLTEEDNPDMLSTQEVEESTGRFLSYYDTDLVIIDWDAAIVMGQQDNLDDVLHIMELANVQLLELAAYDRILDNSLETAYRDLAQRRSRPGFDVHRKIREIRVDLARLSDELVNISKFFGDWHLARIYQDLSKRFHLADWYGIISEKLKTLGDLYQLLQQEWVNFWMVVLETTIVALFILDVILLLVGL